MGPSQISDAPFQGYVIVCISLISTLAIPKLDIDFCELYTKNVAVSLQALPPKFTIYHYCNKRVVSDGTFPNLWMSFPWT